MPNSVNDEKPKTTITILKPIQSRVSLLFKKKRKKKYSLTAVGNEQRFLKIYNAEGRKNVHLLLLGRGEERLGNMDTRAAQTWTNITFFVFSWLAAALPLVSTKLKTPRRR